MTDYIKQLESKVKDCKNTNTIFDTRKYILLEDAFYAFNQHCTKAENLPISGVSSSTFTIDDMKKAFMAGADKKNWTKIHLTGVVSGQDYELEPIFEKWFKHYR